jgi:SAM-dependent methyltransferase
MKSTDTVWLYWQGPRPGYIDLCLRSVLAHHPEARALDRARFDELWRHDRDIDIDRLAPNHQSDFIRAYLLKHHGGLYLDADCIVLRSLSPLLALAEVHGFVGYREPQGYMSCNFMAARAEGAVISDHYRRVCARLRDPRPLEWLDLASTPMDLAIADYGSNAVLLPVRSVMPIAWNESVRLAIRRDDAGHEREFFADAWCYMLSNNTIKSDERTRVLGYMPADHLIVDRYALSWLLRRALDVTVEAESGAAPEEALPEHLGGHEGKTQFDEGGFDYLSRRFDVKSFLDVGCGPAGMVYYAMSRGMRALGIDGDPTLARNAKLIVEHDYASGPIDVGEFDLGWAVEFVEHVDECHVPNFMATLARCKVVFITAAVPGQPGHHHVNCQWGDYWIARFADSGFDYDIDATLGVRAASTMRSRFTEQTGLVFTRRG